MINTTLNKFDKKTSALVINVKLSKQFRVRIWIALKLIYLASLILGCAIEVNEE